ncbi:MAG: DUF5625 family protein [Rhodocyclaceae bacterium]|nr:DUF5625 family protein [Rhodocyclaceae bacterium]
MSAIGVTGIARSARLWVCLLCLSPWLLACASDSGPKKIPVEVPFALDKGGEVVELEVLIPERQTYTFGIGFGVNRKIPGDSKRVLELTGDASWNERTRTYGNLGIPLKVRLEIESVKPEEKPFRFDQEVSEIPLYAGTYEAFQKMIANVLLEAGTYRVRVTNQLAARPTQGTPINFHIRRAWFGK